MIEKYVDFNQKNRVIKECNLDMLDEIDEYEIDLYKTLLWAFIKIDNKFDMDSLKSDVIEGVTSSLNAHYGGSKEEDGWLELYFYAQHAKKFENTVVLALAKYLNIGYELGNSKDGKFKHFETILYPNELQLQQIQTTHILDALKDEGDDLSNPREVEHYAFFQTEAQCERLIRKMQDRGFSLKDSHKDETREHAYCAVLCNVQSVEFDDIFKSLKEVYDSVKVEHGIYEGWSTTLS